MSDFLPIIAAVLTTVGAIVSGVLVTRRLSKYGLSTEQLQVTSSLRQLAEVEAQKRGLLEVDLAAAKAKLEATQHDLDDCERQLSDTRAELRIRKRDDVADETRGRQRTARRDARSGDE